MSNAAKSDEYIRYQKWIPRLTEAANQAKALLRRAPFTLAFVVLLWVVGIISGSLLNGPPASLLSSVGVGPGSLGAGLWWTPASSLLWCDDLTSYIFSTLLLFAFVAPAEHRFGVAKTFSLLLLTHITGTLAGSAIVYLASRAGDEWTEQLTTVVTVGASPAAVGVGLAMTSRLSALWRRRVRLLTLMALLLLVAYSGTLLDVLRLAAGLVGLVAGPLLLGRSPRAAGVRTSQSERRVLVALIVAGTAVGPVIAALSDTPIGPLSVLRYLLLTTPPDASAVQQICLDPTTLDDCRTLRAQLRLSGFGPAIMALMPVILLVVSAAGLRRGRRAAWWAALVVNLALAAMAVLLATELFGTPREQLVVFGGLGATQTLLAILLPLTLPLVVAGLLVATRTSFTVRAPTGTYRRLGLLAGGTLLLLCAIYVVGGYAARGQFDQAPTIWQLIGLFPIRLVPPGYLGEIELPFLPSGPIATLLSEWTGVLFLAVLAGALMVSFRRNRPADPATDIARARSLLKKHGGSSLAYMTLWPGNSYFFTSDRQAFVAYRLVGTVAVSVTGPVGARQERPAAVVAFAEFCADQGITPCLYSIDDDVKSVAETQLAWRAVQVAEETMLHLPDLAFTGKKWQDIRTALNKASKTGITAQWWAYPNTPLHVTEQIKAISEEWVADKGLPEMGFTLGGLDELDDPEVRCLVAIDGDHTVHGITSFLPVYRDEEIVGWTLDFMRRRTTGFSGVMEYLIATAALQFRDEGAEFLSLSGAPLARIDRGDNPDSVQRLLDMLGRILEPVYGFRSLLDFKAKFQPTYQPLWMAYPESAALPGIANAITKSYLPDFSPRQGSVLLRKLRS
ncbi:bifunctional lysylphosphatidylglycerol flippase/synthetase MprF [Nakamurella antarctica]|uniref:bifunctional lysylphosphatidylglycerol flippase/synthetase MprF n=1 Tax=Nakamurella antarctica TaxID=1902245 RepID=UPI0013DDE520|nr:DUF2156 domain-containing protein [Nakamurella antarctica]